MARSVSFFATSCPVSGYHGYLFSIKKWVVLRRKGGGWEGNEIEIKILARYEKLELWFRDKVDDLSISIGEVLLQLVTGDTRLAIGPHAVALVGLEEQAFLCHF